MNGRDLEPWRRALIAFYERDCLPARAMNLRNGGGFDYLDERTVQALEAAAAQIPVAA